MRKSSQWLNLYLSQIIQRLMARGALEMMQNDGYGTQWNVLTWLVPQLNPCNNSQSLGICSWHSTEGPVIPYCIG